MASQNYWLMKTEPDVFSFQDLLIAPNRTTNWEGVRNYQARNFLRDQFKLGDLGFIYHSNIEEPAIVGIAEVVKEAYSDGTAVDPKNKYFDEKALKKNVWVMVDIQAKFLFENPVTRERIRSEKKLQDMWVLRPGSRLSIQPVSEKEYKILCKLEKLKSV
jgi:predicted RNA-binding protein with PUA-like domain